MSNEITRRAALQRAAWMLGGAISAPTILGVLAGCGGQADAPKAGAAAASAPKPYVARTLSPEQNELVATISEAIIPQTDTPGARAARVNEFVDAMLTDYLPARERERFLAGLARVDARARRAHGRAFLECPAEQQEAVLRDFDRAAYGAPGEATAAPKGGAAARDPRAAAERNPVTQRVEGAVSTGRSGTSGMMASGAESVDGKVDPEDVGRQAFFRTMKELTLVGYYTSQVGATQELRVMPMGPYLADVPYAQVGRAWA